MSKKKLTILIDWYLPGTKAGGPVRSIFSLVQLLKSEMDISIITTNIDLGSNTPYDTVKPDTWLEQDGVRLYYFSKENLNKQNLTQLLLETKCEVIYLNSFWSYWFSIFIIQLKNNKTLNCPIILAPRGMLGKGALSIKPLKKKFYLLLSKFKGFYDHILFHATNQQELNDIRDQFKNANVKVIANLSSATPVIVNRSKQENELDLFFLSRISKVKNLHYALEVLSKVSSSYTISYSIYGNIEDEAYWQHCLSIIKKLPPHIKVVYKGEIAFDQIQATICKHHYLFLPTLNENFGHSIVESLMSGCPAIISDQTPWNDLFEADAGYSIPISDQNKFISLIEQLAVINNETYTKKANAAITYISKKLNIPLIKENYLKLFHATS